MPQHGLPAVVNAMFTPARDRRPRAERLRCHRGEMELAMAERCSLLEARRLLAERAAQARWQALDSNLTARRLTRESARRVGTSTDPPAEENQPPRWMLFD